MKLEKAIKRLTGIQGDLDVDNEPKDIEALQLGIEAMKKIQYDREPGNRPLYTYLPGETKEN